jgi:hypothetical protein
MPTSSRTPPHAGLDQSDLVTRVPELTLVCWIVKIAARPAATRGRAALPADRIFLIAGAARQAKTWLARAHLWKQFLRQSCSGSAEECFPPHAGNMTF